MLRDFMENADMSDIPIGPQADLIEQLENLNNLVPNQFPRLEVTRKFNWKRGTYQIVQDIRSHLLGGNKYKSVVDIFDRPDRLRSGYYLQRFKRNLGNVDRIITQKRWDGSIWLDDDSVIENLKQEAIDRVVELFDSYDEYNKIIDNRSVEYHPHDGDSYVFGRFLNEILNISYSFRNNTTRIIFNNTEKRIYIIHPFNDIVMNTYHQDDTTPMFKFNNGNVLGLHEISVKKLMYWGLGRNINPRAHIGGVVSKFWYKPEVQGAFHPFVHYPGRYNGRNEFQYHESFDQWKISYGSPSNTCYGNFNYLANNTGLDIVKWCENVYSWLTTFRVGTTHPLNNISTCYYGDPGIHDSEVEDKYYDIIGKSTRECFNRMENYHGTAMQRVSVCNKYCSEETKDTCRGHKRDISDIKAEKLSIWYKSIDWTSDFETIRADSTYPGNFNWSFQGTDDEYPTIRSKNEILGGQESEEHNLQASMLQWVQENS